MNEENSNTSGNPSLNDVIDARLSRRNSDLFWRTSSSLAYSRHMTNTYAS